MKPKEHEGVSSHGSSADGLPAIPERVLLFDPVRIEMLITALLGEYGAEYTLTLALASDLADHRQLGQAANGFRDAVDVLRRTGIDQARAQTLAYEHLMAVTAAVTADIHASSRAGL
ncbi:hypothetical protein [Nocardia wallacei]|uniref:Uncharacterized protein n=1 Tax=Nocardia wallacei TaxID=480035 RepID=A0A7G1KMC4_9NOCA|nr:hypothetical protein [Nocardia wallacei]BCK56190.1 hypothetical protein NWFMUON74_39620 [Nocardia wallacei]